MQLNLTKEDEQKVITKEQTTLETLLRKYHPGPFSDTEEFADEFGDIYHRCGNCEQIMTDEITECQVCEMYFCGDCSAEHSSEETGL